jgi:hypothetical protein
LKNDGFFRANPQYSNIIGSSNDYPCHDQNGLAILSEKNEDASIGKRDRVLGDLDMSVRIGEL